MQVAILVVLLILTFFTLINWWILRSFNRQVDDWAALTKAIASALQITPPDQGL